MWFSSQKEKKNELISIRYTEQGMGWEALEVGRFQVKNDSLESSELIQNGCCYSALGWYGQGLGLTATTNAPEEYRSDIMIL